MELCKYTNICDFLWLTKAHLRIFYSLHEF